MATVQNSLNIEAAAQSSGFTTLHPIERSSILRLADRVGRIPVLGTAVGAVRMISGLAIGIFAALGCLFTYVCGLNKCMQKCSFSATRSFDELSRGFHELFPFLINSIDRRRDEEEKQGRISDWGGAYGRYMYETNPGSFDFICYSENRYEGQQVQWFPRFENQGPSSGTSGGVVGAWGKIINATERA